MEKIQAKGNKQDNQNSISNGGTISKMIMESPLMQQREREHNEMFGEANQLMAKDSNMPIQRLRSQVGGAGDIKTHTTLKSIVNRFGLGDITNDIVIKFKTNDKIADTYLDNYSRISETKAEILNFFNDLVNSNDTIINSNNGDSVTFIDQLYTAVSPLITDGFVANYPYLKKANTFSAKYGNYLAKLRTINVTLKNYHKSLQRAEGAKKREDGEYRYDELEEKQFSALIQKLETKKDELETQLTDAVNGGTDTDEILTNIDNLADEIPAVEVRWKGFIELDHRFESEDIAGKLDTFITDSGTEYYNDDGGVDDGMNVGNEYDKGLACSLFAILTLKPGWLGADTPKKLHDILRRTNDLKDYDDNKKAAYVRYLAGLTPTAQNQTLGEYIEGRGADRSSFIVDPTDAAHTFAVVYKGAAGYKRYDNDTGLGGAGGVVNMDTNLAAIWK